eukprot:gnl/MRDRNA2_/MRDRNA2_121345_c0_seq1.p1 gnl/MRDRNA2_/MRDRNA2_121345_c0~~gnl/MRDRNA2_/MRDRNA2_121345_c0_seq1.p1  ORF type:complete len:489 (-),score=79.43 gnl/MRDRNA2_/MRDRNA2_121345_c0_seq1:38-1504(-)
MPGNAFIIFLVQAYACVPLTHHNSSVRDSRDQIDIDNLLGRSLNRNLQAWLLGHNDLDKTLLRKPGHLSLKTQHNRHAVPRPISQKASMERNMRQHDLEGSYLCQIHRFLPRCIVARSYFAESDEEIFERYQKHRDKWPELETTPPDPNDPSDPQNDDNLNMANDHDDDEDEIEAFSKKKKKKKEEVFYNPFDDEEPELAPEFLEDSEEHLKLASKDVADSVWLLSMAAAETERKARGKAVKYTNVEAKLGDYVGEGRDWQEWEKPLIDENYEKINRELAEAREEWELQRAYKNEILRENYIEQMKYANRDAIEDLVPDEIFRLQRQLKTTQREVVAMKADARRKELKAQSQLQQEPVATTKVLSKAKAKSKGKGKAKGKRKSKVKTRKAVAWDSAVQNDQSVAWESAVQSAAVVKRTRATTVRATTVARRRYTPRKKEPEHVELLVKGIATSNGIDISTAVLTGVFMGSGLTLTMLRVCCSTSTDIW